MGHTGVGRNKAFRAQARISVSGTLYDMPETPPRATLGWPYSGLRLLLVIAVSLESSIKNLKAEYKRLLSAPVQ